MVRAPEAGGGALIDIGMHILGLTMRPMGSSKPVTAFGSTFDNFGPRDDPYNPSGPHYHAEFDADKSALPASNSTTETAKALQRVEQAVRLESVAGPYHRPQRRTTSSLAGPPRG